MCLAARIQGYFFSMAKELPYFQFEPAEYLTKDISFCSLAAQGLFINICSYYWQRSCQLTKQQLLRRLNHESELNELITEGVIDLIENDIKIKFLDEQLEKATSRSKTNAINGSKGGRPKKKSEKKPNGKQTESKSKGIREDKIRRDKRIEDKKSEFKNSLSEHLDEFGKEILNDFYAYWTELNPSKTKMRFEMEKTFEIKRRLSRWRKNNYNSNTNQHKPGKVVMRKINAI